MRKCRIFAKRDVQPSRNNQLFLSHPVQSRPDLWGVDHEGFGISKIYPPPPPKSLFPIKGFFFKRARDQLDFSPNFGRNFSFMKWCWCHQEGKQGHEALQDWLGFPPQISNSCCDLRVTSVKVQLLEKHLQWHFSFSFGSSGLARWMKLFH